MKQILYIINLKNWIVMIHYNVNKLIYCKQKLYKYFEWFRDEQNELNDKYITMCNGVYDIPHIGHMDVFNSVVFGSLKSRRRMHPNDFSDNNFKVIAINSDKSVKILKGDKRPFFSLEERIEFIRHLDLFDLIIPFDEPSPIEVMKIVRPDIVVKTKGGPYSKDSIPIIERKLFKSIGTIIEWVPYVENISTTKIVERVLEKEKG